MPKIQLFTLNGIQGLKRKTLIEKIPILITKKLAIHYPDPGEGAKSAYSIDDQSLSANSLIGIVSIKKVPETDLPLYLGYTHIWLLLADMIKNHERN